MTEGVALLDVNVLMALAWPNHVHHQRAHAWFSRQTAWATCPLTQSGFVRVSSNRSAVPDARTPTQARTLLAEILEIPGHQFWPDAVSIADLDQPLFASVVSYRQVTDAHLLALAASHKGTLATFDRGISALVPDSWAPDSAVVLVP